MTSTTPDLDYLLALHQHAAEEADTLEAEAADLERRAHDKRQRAAKLRACLSTLERFG